MTPNYIFSLSLIDYKIGDQHDAHECLLQWLSKMYLVITNKCMFKIVELESTVCENPICDQRIDKTADEYVLSLIVEDTVDNQNISNILGRTSDCSGSFNAEYWSEKCNVVSSAKI